MNLTISERNRQVVEKIKATSLFRSYAKAFETVTGLPLSLQPMHGEGASKPCGYSQFCQELNAGSVCRDCQCMHNEIMRDATDHAVTKQCPMGLTETAVPVRFGEETIAVLRTGQVRYQASDRGALKALSCHLHRAGLEEDQIEHLAETYQKVAVMEESKYEQTVTMLAIFSLHVSTLINQLILAQGESEQPVVAAAKRYIREHLDEKLTLEAVAGSIKVSPFYFCKVFKQDTGMTFTEYVNRKRVELAKKELLKPHVTVTEVAFEVGYQSLSQFNRSFLRYAGEAPTKYRKRMSAGASRTAQVA